ncbi:MAG: phosphoribosylformylglycinamidine cyclo-ligase [Candidatus Carbobacillus sp.]|nr:phosphoribosylformylglycinamidine cyclo-ligase [Candidatus Carbobacillus sp.]
MREAYERAGVAVDRGYEAVRRIKKHALETYTDAVKSGIGGFAALYSLESLQNAASPLTLVASADGVGTKTLLAEEVAKKLGDQSVHVHMGVDCVAMCVNDLLAQGGEPLFFLDYIAMSTLDVDKIEALSRGMAEGCKEAGCALIGGETAEMPDVYKSGAYDLAGFAVGRLVRGENHGRIPQLGDVLIGVPSSGLHSNGFSLVRRWVEGSPQELARPFLEWWETLTPTPAFQGEKENWSGRTLGEVLLTPTRIYVKSLKTLLQHPGVAGMAHITGGGLLENIPRILPDTLAADIRFGYWPLPPVYAWVKQVSGLTWEALMTTFNVGLGMIIVVDPEAVEEVMDVLRRSGQTPYRVGNIVPRTHAALLFQEVGDVVYHF